MAKFRFFSPTRYIDFSAPLRCPTCTRCHHFEQVGTSNDLACSFCNTTTTFTSTDIGWQLKNVDMD